MQIYFNTANLDFTSLNCQKFEKKFVIANGKVFLIGDIKNTSKTIPVKAIGNIQIAMKL